MTDETKTPSYIDDYDEPVVTRLEEGEVYSAIQLDRAYKQYTAITNDGRAEQRRKNLFDSPCMEYTGTPGKFRFIGLEEVDVL